MGGKGTSRAREFSACGYLRMKAKGIFKDVMGNMFVSRKEGSKDEGDTGDQSSRWSK